MSLATRCTSCGTAFRVVQDQLKVSEGWVRCGRCDSVFNALEGLFDLGRDAPTGWDRPAEPKVPLALAPAVSGSAAAREDHIADHSDHADHADPVGRAHRRDDDESGAGDDGDDGGDDDEATTSDLGELLADPIDAHLFGPRKRAESAPKPAGQLGARDRVEFSDARFDSDLFSENTSVPDTELVAMPATDAGALALESSVRPDFVRRADRRARWHSRSMRTTLAALSMLAALALALQVAHHQRDTLAARWPSLRAPLVAWCEIARCRLEAPRRIDEVFVESTALTRAAGPDAFMLSVTLKSRSALTVALPSIDLTLTDANGRLVARRALTPRDFRAAEVLAPNGEAGLQALLSAGTPAVVGYTVEIFYP